MATASATYHKPKSGFQIISPGVKFDADFIERRMREHREYQDELASKCAAEIVHEVVGALECFAEMRMKPVPQPEPKQIARLK